jgi:membrane fusion protein, multidrug efflux system
MDVKPPENDFPDPSKPDNRKPNPFVNAFASITSFVGNFVKNPANIRKLIIIVVAIITLVLIRNIFFPKKEEYKRPATEEGADKGDRVPVKAFKVGRFNFEDAQNSLGSIKGMVEFKLSFEIPGVISAINYREGEYYEEGALLISMRQDDILLRLKRSQAQAKKAHAALQIAQEKYKEHEKLFTIGAIPQTTLERVAFEVDQAKFEGEAASIEMKANEAVLEKSNLYAPSAGTIGELNIEEGEAITQNTLVGTHVRTDRVVANFGVTERDINKISLGQKAKVFVDAYADKSFEGIVENIAPVIVGSSRTADVRVRIENPEGLLRPGMFARIKITLYQKKNTLVVPTDAMVGKENDQYVFVIDPEEKTVTKTPIVVGYTRIDYAQIDSGIREEDLIVVTGMDRLEDGSKVRIMETQEAEL